MELNSVPATDAMYVRIDRVTQTASTTFWGNTGTTLTGLTHYSAGAIPATLAALQAATLTEDATGQSLTVFATAIELIDFGIAAGSTIASLNFGSTTSTALVDPVLIMGLTPPATGGPVISEAMASNNNGIEDEDADRPDWIEIYNGQATPVNLIGWTLSDDPAQPAKWTFPSIPLPAFGSTYIFASGRNRHTDLHAHTNFTLNSTAGVLILRRPDGTTASTQLRPAGEM